MSPILISLVILQGGPTTQQEQRMAPACLTTTAMKDDLDAYTKCPNPTVSHSPTRQEPTDTGQLYKENEQKKPTRRLCPSEHLRTNSRRDTGKDCSSNIVSEGEDLTGLDCNTRNFSCLCIVNSAYCVKKTPGFSCTLIGNFHSIFLCWF